MGLGITRSYKSVVPGGRISQEKDLHGADKALNEDARTDMGSSLN